MGIPYHYSICPIAIGYNVDINICIIKPPCEHSVVSKFSLFKPFLLRECLNLNRF